MLIDCSGWDIHDLTYSRELLISNKENGYRDLLAIVDLSTYRSVLHARALVWVHAYEDQARRISWEQDVPFFLVTFCDPDSKEPISCDPRGALQNAVKKLDAKGYQALAGVEYEYFQFKGKLLV